MPVGGNAVHQAFDHPTGLGVFHGGRVGRKRSARWFSRLQAAIVRIRDAAAPRCGSLRRRRWLARRHAHRIARITA